MGKTRDKNRLLPQANGHVPTFAAIPPRAEVPLLKLDLGCGPNPQAGFEGVDQYAFGGKVRHVLDLRTGRWPWPDRSVSEIHCAHFLEHLTNLDGKWERVHFFNEVYRILTDPVYADGKPVSGFATILVPHWCSSRYYGDPTHCEPFSEFGLYYLLKKWRADNAPHADVSNNPDGYSCDLDSNQWYNIRGDLVARNSEYQQHAIGNFKEACQDLVFRVWRMPETPGVTDYYKAGEADGR